jgi:hypothetical protein
VTLDLDALAALAEAATRESSPAPWHTQPWPSRFVVDANGDGVCSSVCETDAEQKLIAAAVNAVPALIARVRELEAEVDRLKAALSRYGHHDWHEDAPDISCREYRDGPETCDCGFRAALDPRYGELWPASGKEGA